MALIYAFCNHLWPEREPRIAGPEREVRRQPVIGILGPAIQWCESAPQLVRSSARSCAGVEASLNSWMTGLKLSWVSIARWLIFGSGALVLGGVRSENLFHIERR